MHYEHFGSALTGRKLSIRAAEVARCLRAYNIKPGVIVMRGVSGMAVGFLVAAKFGCQYAVIRKDPKTSHGSDVEGSFTPKNGGSIVIVDDFVNTGETVLKMQATIPKGTPIVVACYQREGAHTYQPAALIPPNLTFLGTKGFK